MGGGRGAQGLAGLMIIPVPAYLMLDHWLTMNAFEPLLWAGLFWMVLRMVLRKEPRYWLAIGALCGVGLLTKYSMLVPMVALAAALVASPYRALLKSRWFAAGVGLCVLLVLPNVIWELRHGFPFLEFEANSRASGSRILRGPVDFILDQMLMMNPLTAPLWLGGLAWLLRKPFRLIGWAFLGVFLLFLALKAKNYYVAPLYPVAFAAGAVWMEGWGRVRIVYAGAALAAGAVLAPLVLPVFPISDFVEYRAALGGLNPVRMENLPRDSLPQNFADEFGWREMAVATAGVYSALPEEERRDTAIFANNYGEAGAIDFFGGKYGLPKAISTHVSYWLWGARAYSGKTVIVLGSDGAGDRKYFREVEAAARIDDPDARPEERFDIFLCRDLTERLDRLWPKIRKW